MDSSTHPVPSPPVGRDAASSRQQGVAADAPGGRDTSLSRLPREPVFGRFTLARSARHAAADRLDEAGACRYTTSGRAAILLALRCLGVGPGDRVLLPTYHCPTMVEPTLRLGAQAVFYPIGRDGRPDLAHLRQADRHAVKAILAAHYFGLPQDLSALRAWCDESGIALVEDCAHAYFGRSAAGPVGCLGDLAIGSLPKFFPAVEGGCLTGRGAALPPLRAPGLMTELRSAWDVLEIGSAAGRLDGIGRVVGALAKLKRGLRGQRDVGPTAQPTESESALAAACNTVDVDRAGQRATWFTRWLVRHCDALRIVTTRRENYRLYAMLFEGDPRMRPLFAQLPDGAVPYVFPLEVDGADALYRRLRERGVPLFRWDMVWPGTPSWPGDAGARWSRSVFQLACHQDLTADDVRAIVDVVRQEAGRLLP